MPGVDFRCMQNMIPMVEVLRLVGFHETSRSGPQAHGCCPVHGSKSEQSRSFSVNLQTSRYYCHRCKSRGNQIELWKSVRKMTLHAAAIDLCRAAGRDVPWIHRW